MTTNNIGNSLPETFLEQRLFWEMELMNAFPGDCYVDLCKAEIAQLKCKQEALTRVYQHFCSVGAGLELRNKSRSLSSVVLPDASAPGAYRYQVFGQAGFYDINQCNSLGEALVCAVEEGFTDYDPGAMAALFGNEEWRKGMQVSEIYIVA